MNYSCTMFYAVGPYKFSPSKAEKYKINKEKEEFTSIS